MKFGFSQSEIITTAKSLGLPTDGFIQRRVARAFDLVETNKVSQIDDGIFRVRSQYEPSKSYIVNVNHGFPSCDCPDGQQRTIHCKHRIASLLYQRQAQAKQAKALTIYDDTKNSYLGRGRWIVTDHKARVKYIIYRDSKGKLHCPCNPRNRDCEHKKAIREYLTGVSKTQMTIGNNGGNLTSITNECGSELACAIQDKLNGQLDSQGNNGNGAQASFPQLDVSDPFQEAESYDIDQIEGRANGDLAWKLRNGEYVISYRGIMTLAEKRGIEFTISLDNKTNTVIAKAMNGSERVSGKEIKIAGSVLTASELAKRNAARQLLPLPEIKAMEKKAQLESEFDWQKAKAKCVELVGTDANVDIIIHELTQASKLRQDNPSHYDRTEWLIIYDACKQDQANDDDNNNDGEGKNPSSSKLQECKDTALNAQRFDWLKADLQQEGALPDRPITDWQDQDFETLKQACALDASLFNRALGDDWIIQKERNWGGYESGRRYRFWLVTKDTEQLREKCFVCGKTKSNVKLLSDDMIYWERYEIKISLCNECESTDTETLTKKFDELYHNGNGAIDGKTKSSVVVCTTGLPKTAEDFVKRCKQAIDKVRASKEVEANEQPLEGDNGKRKLVMDKKLKTWLVETDLTSTEISCKEICEKFESEKNPNIVTRLRAGIDSGADLSTVELD